MYPKKAKITWEQDDYGDVLVTATDFSNYSFNQCREQYIAEIKRREEGLEDILKSFIWEPRPREDVKEVANAIRRHYEKGLEVKNEG